MNSLSTKQAILAEISQSRGAMIRDFRTFKDRVKNEMNFTEKLRGSVRTYPPIWLGGAAITSYFFTRVLGGGRKKKHLPIQESPILKGKGGGTLVSIFRFLYPLLKPAVIAYATNKLYKMARN